jgi:type II secretory pathway component GspD/PulD (secretin)
VSDGIEVLVEQNTPEWHAFRRTGGPGNPYPAALGASDVGILMGGTREERERLFMEKCGALVEQEPTLQMQQGHDAEPFIREQYMERIEVAGRPATLYSPDFPFLFASCDFLSDSAEVIAEFKRMAAARHERLRETGPEPRVYWQCMAQLNVVRQARSCHLVGALFMDIADLALVVILPDEEEFLRIIAMATRFLTGVREGDRAYALGDSETLAGAPGGEGTVEPPPAPGPIAPPGAAWRQPGPLFPSPEDVKAAGGGEFEQRLAAPLGLEAAFKGKAITPADIVAEAERMARSIVARFTPQRDAMLARFTAIEITDGATADEASAMFGQATKIEGQVGDELTRMRKHFTNAADAISAVVKPFIAPIADAKPKLKVKLNAYIERVNAESAPAATAEMESLVEQPQVVVIESTNSLLVNATPEQHAQIATIISYVDNETLKRAIPYEIYALENQNPEDLAGVLQKFIEETVKDKEGKVQQTIKKTEEDIIIVPDKNTFSILVYASKKNQEWIGSLIKQLDKRRPQVLIDVMLVAITEDDSFTYDLQLVSKLPQMAAGGTLLGLANPLPLSTPFPSGTVKEVTSSPGTTGLQGFYADSHIQALLKLMAKKGYGRVLARPKILVNDNEKGHIDTTTTLYVARTSSQYLPNTVVTPTTTTTPTNTAITSTTFDQYPSGIKLDITPHISEGSLLRLEMQMSRSSQAPPASGAGVDTPPNPKTEDNVNTVVTVPDSSTIILGGIITLNQVKNTSKVPFLGDIPIAGGLFRSINNTSNQSKLYVFVKANILRPDDTVAGLEDLRKISNRNRDAFERYEEKFQEHKDWPGIEPKPVDPLRVLESE